MIKKPSNWDSVPTFTERPKLPVGGYVCKIKKAVVQNTGFGDQLCILFDIEDGEYAGFYANDFENQRNEKKWKGVLKYKIPKDDGSDKDEWYKTSFKTMTTALEDSNKGFTWNWDESKLNGKMLGIIFRNEEWEYNGKTGWTARPYSATSVAAIEDGRFTIPKDKPKQSSDNNSAAVATTVPFAEQEDDGDLPF